jgi:tyrosyl-tRNA synthetase
MMPLKIIRKMDAEKKFELIKKNTAEIIEERELMQLLETKKEPVAYIGLATTGKIHAGYLVPALKIKDFTEAGFKFKILLADLHAHLDDQKAPVELLEKRTKYYKETISAVLEAIGCNTKKIEFVTGRSYQLKPEYTMDVYRLASLNTFDRCKRAAAGVVRFGENPKLSGFIYPILQALDEEYLGVDVQYGGTDQRKILMFARENLPRIGYKPRIEIMTPMIAGLKGTKMSSSEETSKIDLLDSEETIHKKISKANCPIAKEENGILETAKHIIFAHKKEINIQRPEKYGGNKKYEKYDELEKEFLSGKLHPMDLKNAIANELNEMLEKVRQKMKGKEKIIEEAFP